MNFGDVDLTTSPNLSLYKLFSAEGVKALFSRQAIYFELIFPLKGSQGCLGAAAENSVYLSAVVKVTDEQSLKAEDQGRCIALFKRRR